MAYRPNPSEFDQPLTPDEFKELHRRISLLSPPSHAGSLPEAEIETPASASAGGAFLVFAHPAASRLWQSSRPPSYPSEVCCRFGFSRPDDTVPSVLLKCTSHSHFVISSSWAAITDRLFFKSAPINSPSSRLSNPVFSSAFRQI